MKQAFHDFMRAMAKYRVAGLVLATILTVIFSLVTYQVFKDSTLAKYSGGELVTLYGIVNGIPALVFTVLQWRNQSENSTD